MRVELRPEMSLPYRVGNRGFTSLVEATEYLHSRIAGPHGVKCPWCQRGMLENTPRAYNDPPTIVYCPECSSVFELKQKPKLSPD